MSKARSYVIVLADEDSIQINIESENINKPNNPDDYDIIVEYIHNNYGHKSYEIVALDDIKHVTIH